MNTVYTYFAPIEAIDSEEQLREIAVWRKSWERYGWECKVLGPSHLAISPETVRLTREIERKNFPSANVPGYDLHCFLRWVALLGQDGGLMTDYDTVNIGYTTEKHSRIINDGRERRVEFCAWRTPAMLYVNQGACMQLLREFLSYEPMEYDVIAGKQHVSDMTIMQNMELEVAPLPPELAICQELNDQRADCKVVHVSHNAIRLLGWGGPRWLIMDRIFQAHAR